MQVIETLAKHNYRRGVISWRYVQGADGSYFAIRNDGRKYPFASQEAFIDGIEHMRDVMGYAPVSLLTV